MRVLFVFWVLVLACGGGSVRGDVDGGGGGGGGGDAPPVDGKLAGVLEAHNAVRASHGQAPLVWDSGLAAMAAAWLEQCVDVQVPFGGVDENPHLPDDVGHNERGSPFLSYTGKDAVRGWASAEQQYSYSTNYCVVNGYCADYLQMVWGTTTQVGCGYHYCPALPSGVSVACYYRPRMIPGQRPY